MIVIGKERVIDQIELTSSVNKTLVKGLEAEVFVTDYLARTADETYTLIAHPQIGKYQPDILVVHESVILLVEVKNWSSNSIINVFNNGKIDFIGGHNNPLEQVKKHRDGLALIIKSELKLNVYNDIKYCVIHMGISRTDAESKTSSKWSKDDQKNFYQHHIFCDELDKFSQLLDCHKSKRIMSHKLLKKLVHIVEPTKGTIQFDSSDLLNALEAQDSKLEYLLESHNLLSTGLDEVKRKLHFTSSSDISIGLEDDLISAVKETDEEYRFVDDHEVLQVEGFQDVHHQPRQIRWIKSKFALPIMVLLVFLMIYLWVVQGDLVSNSILNEPSNGSNHENAVVTINAELNDFSYHQESGTKFLILDYEGETLNAVIFNNVNVPYLNIGSMYMFTGKYQDYKGNIELVILSIGE